VGVSLFFWDERRREIAALGIYVFVVVRWWCGVVAGSPVFESYPLLSPSPLLSSPLLSSPLI
jgi:hypothetical protein